MEEKSQTQGYFNVIQALAKQRRDAIAAVHARFPTPFDAGYDYAKNGADEDNCHFIWFGSVTSLAEWERGRDSFDEDE